MHTPDLFAPEPPAKPAPLTTCPDSDLYPYVWAIGPTTCRPYDTQLLDGIRALLTAGSMQFGELFDAFHDQQEGVVISAHLRKLQAKGHIIETQDFIGAADPRDPNYRGWISRFALAEQPESINGQSW